MKTLYLECKMGAAGDMLMSALYELLPDQASFLHIMNHLHEGISISMEKKDTCGIRGSHAVVDIGGKSRTPKICPAVVSIATRSCTSTHRRRLRPLHTITSTNRTMIIPMTTKATRITTPRPQISGAYWITCRYRRKYARTRRPFTTASHRRSPKPTGFRWNTSIFMR